LKITSLLGIVATLAISLSAAAQQLTWSSEYKDWNTSNIGGGTTERPTIASAVFNNLIYIAYTSSDYCDADHSCAIRIKDSAGQGPNGEFAFSESYVLSVPTIGQIFSKVNPAMGAQNGVVYIAWTDPDGNNKMSITTDMSNWSAPLSIPTGTTIESIGLSFNPSQANQVWLSYVLSNQDASLCEVIPNTSAFSSSSVSCNTVTTTGTQMLYNPGLVFSANNVGSPYMFLTWHGNSHCLSSFYSGSTGWTYWNSGGLCGSQTTSSAPDPVFYNGYLYVAFRSNDSAAAFKLIGGSISTYPYYNWSRLPTGGQHMDGSPDLLPITNSKVSLLYPSELVNFYARGGYLYSVYGH
jgi:hypothetical protein